MSPSPVSIAEFGCLNLKDIMPSKQNLTPLRERDKKQKYVTPATEWPTEEDKVRLLVYLSALPEHACVMPENPFTLH
jgi:hypothetical protein